MLNRLVNTVCLLILLSLMITDIYAEISVAWYILLAIFFLAAQSYGSIVLSAQYFVPVLFKGERSVKAIALTFDDGPVPGKTEMILRILKDHDVKASFFCIGNRVKTNPGIVRNIHSEGHLVANHSFWHGRTFDLQTSEKILQELKDTNAAIKEVTGLTPNFFRPPYGVTNPMVASAIRKASLITVGWSVRSFDTVIKDRSKLFSRVTKSLKGGDIILFHDFCDATIEILPDLIQHIRKNGLKIVRVDELLNEKPYV